MAHVTLLNIPASAMVGDNDAQLVAGDNPAPPVSHKGRPALSFDDTDEEAALTPELAMPGQYTGGILKATLFLYAASDALNTGRYDVFVEAITPNVDTLDLEAATSWDIANSADVDLSGTTAGDLVAVEIGLANKDGAVAGDLVRFGVRRDTDHANDDASGDIFLSAIEIWELT